MITTNVCVITHISKVATWSAHTVSIMATSITGINRSAIADKILMNSTSLMGWNSARIACWFIPYIMGAGPPLPLSCKWMDLDRLLQQLYFSRSVYSFDRFQLDFVVLCVALRLFSRSECFSRSKIKLFYSNIRRSHKSQYI